MGEWRESVLGTRQQRGIKVARMNHPLAISQFLDAKIRLRNQAEPGTIGGVCAGLYETGIIGGGDRETGNIGGSGASDPRV